MDQFKRFSQFRYITLLLVALLLNSLRPVSASLSMQHMNIVAASEDIMLIFTGKGMKWASLSTFEITGQLKFVDPPSELEGADTQHCPLYFWLDTQDQNATPAHLILILNRLGSEYIVRGQDIAGVYAHPCPPSRGPPLTSA